MRSPSPSLFVRERHPFPTESPRPDLLDIFQVVVPEAAKQYLDHQIHRVNRPNGSQGYHHLLRQKEGVMVAHTEIFNGRVWVPLVDSFRYPLRDKTNHGWSRELPSGGVDLVGLDPSDLDYIHLLKEEAARELLEETGIKLSPSKMQNLFSGPLQGMVGMADQTYHIMHGTGGEFTNERKLEPSEAGTTMRMHELSIIDDMIGREIVDTATSAAIGRLTSMYSGYLD